MATKVWLRSRSTKLQAPNNKYIPMVQIPNRRKAFWSFEIEIWDLFGICNLVFGISTLFGSGYAELGEE
jgi:hypothetical protein